MRDMIKDTLSLLAEKFYYLVEGFYRRANAERAREPKAGQKRSSERLQALPAQRLPAG